MKPASSSTQQRARPRPFGLTAEQTELYDSVVPHVVDNAVGMIVNTYHARDQEDDLRQEGVIALGVGIPTFDPARGTPFPLWAYWTAASAMLRVVRVECRHRRRIAAVRAALALHAAFEAGTGDALRGVMDLAFPDDAPPSTRRITASAVAQLAAEPPAAEGEDGVVLREDHARLVEVLQRLFAELRPEQRELLRRCHAGDGGTLKDAAGGPAGAKRHRAAVRMYHAVIALLGARLTAAGIHELPPWPAGGIETILGEDDDDHETAGPPSRLVA
jgi:DNA-directed RNA polymerase specialized sigma24 family protein